MNTIEQAASDLREAEAALAAYTPKTELEKAVEIAKAAVLSAARGVRPSDAMLAEMESADEIAEKKDKMLAGMAAHEAAEETIPDPIETTNGEDEFLTVGADGELQKHSASEDLDIEAEASDDEAESADDEIFEESNLAEVSATAADVVNAVNEALPAETIDATDEVSAEEAIAAADTSANGHLGQNWPRA